jgi:hypothetical protein
MLTSLLIYFLNLSPTSVARWSTWPPKFGGYCSPTIEKARSQRNRFGEWFACPPPTKGLPTALVEAATKRGTVVSADDVGAREFKHDDDRALVVPLRLMEALTDALSRILEESVFANRLRHSGFNRLLNGFTNKAVFARAVAVFQSHEPEISFTFCREAERIRP